MRSIHVTVSRGIRAAVLGGAASLALVLAVLAGTALAADQNTPPADTLGPHTHQLHGTVDSTPAAGATSFALDTERYGQVVVTLAGAAPRGNAHGRGQARSVEVMVLSELKAGERVVVQGSTSADGTSFVARRVHALPSRDGSGRPSHLVGTVAAVTTASGASTLLVKLADGTTQSVSVPAATRIRPAGETLADLRVGTKVTVVSKNGIATGVVIMPS